MRGYILRELNDRSHNLLKRPYGGRGLLNIFDNVLTITTIKDKEMREG